MGKKCKSGMEGFEKQVKLHGAPDGVHMYKAPNVALKKIPKV
jgi:hypothetical protein